LEPQQLTLHHSLIKNIFHHHHELSTRAMKPFSSSEYLDRVKYEFDIMISQLSMTKIENERLKGEKEELVHQANKVSLKPLIAIITITLIEL